MSFIINSFLVSARFEEMQTIKRLPKSVHSSLRSGVILSVRLCVCECVWVGTTVGLPAH
jgi:hypothetical protein